jgi:3-oxoacid CoA-transferase
MAATRRSCTRLSALLPSTSNALFRAQLPRATARLALTKRAGVAATVTFTRGFINDVKAGGNGGVDSIELDEGLAPTIDRSRSKVYASADEAVADIKSGSTILSAGFGLCGTAGMFCFCCFPCSRRFVGWYREGFELTEIRYYHQSYG